MIFAISCFDGPDGKALRAEHRPAHLAYLKGAGARVLLAGPLQSTDEDGQPLGSLIIIDAASQAAVKLFAENDPYAQAGVFSNVEIRPYKPVLGSWMGET